jgi:predicted site-specific integrase-resolvase
MHRSPTEPISHIRFGVDPVVPLRDAAAIVGCHPDTLKNQAKRGKLQLLRISQRRLGIRQSEFNRYLSEATIAYASR